MRYAYFKQVNLLLMLNLRQPLGCVIVKGAYNEPSLIRTAAVHSWELYVARFYELREES